MKFDVYRKKTFTNSWNNFGIKPKTKNSFSIQIKKIKKFIGKFFKFHLHIKIIKNKNVKDVPFHSYQIDHSVINYRNKALVKRISIFLNLYKIEHSDKIINDFIVEYYKIFSKSKVTDLGSGFGFNEGLFLFCIIKLLKPTFIIESGIMRGFTSYIIDAATDENIIMACYDINFENIQFKSSKATYYNTDISENIPNLEGHKVLAFWDDHISQLERLIFSLNHKIKFNIFDDDLSFLNFHSDGWPPIPSITMLSEINRNIINTDRVEWICRNKKGSIDIHDLKKTNPFKNVKYHNHFPNIFDVTGYKSHSQCSLVITK